MTKSEWIPSSKRNPCGLCGNISNWCSTSATDDDTITCKNTTTAPDGWKKLKDTKDGGGVFKLTNGENYTRPERTESPKTVDDIKYRSADHQTRDRVYRRLISNNGDLDAIYRAELERRGLSSENIDTAIDRDWFSNWQRSNDSDFHSQIENVAGIDPTTGKTCSWEGLFLPAIKGGSIVGGQIYPKLHIEQKLGRLANVPNDLGKYIWLSSSKHGGANAHCFDTGENPLFLREHPDTRPDAVENLNLCEGALKSTIACLKFEDRGQLDPFIGASGGRFSMKEVKQCLDRYPNLKTVTLYPDAGSIENPSTVRNYLQAIELIRKLTDGRVKILVAWWGQLTKADRDVDELTTEDLENLIIQPWENSIMGETIPTQAVTAEATSVEEEQTDKAAAKDGKLGYNTSHHNGLVLVHMGKDAEGEPTKVTTKIGNHLEAIAVVDNPEQNQSSLQLEFKTFQGHIRRVVILRSDLAGDGTAIISMLLGLGYAFKRKQKAPLLDYLHGLGIGISKKYTVTESTGWVNESFVMPHKTYGDPDLRYRDIDPIPDVITEIKGTLQGWKDNVAAHCAGNSRSILALGSSFAAPLLPIVDVESGGFHLVGATSQGKTTILSIAASVTGLKTVSSWRTTDNALEGGLAASNHLCLPLDLLQKSDREL